MLLDIDKHAQIVAVHCEQIAKTKTLICEQPCPIKPLSVNVTTRRNIVT